MDGHRPLYVGSRTGILLRRKLLWSTGVCADACQAIHVTTDKAAIAGVTGKCCSKKNWFMGSPHKLGRFRRPNCSVFFASWINTPLYYFPLFVRFCISIGCSILANPLEIPIAAACFLSFPTSRAKRAFLQEKYLCLLSMSAQKLLNYKFSARSKSSLERVQLSVLDRARPWLRSLSSRPTDHFDAAALGVGEVRGRVIEVFGPESSGKTTITLQIIAEAQRNGGRYSVVDAESHALDPPICAKNWRGCRQSAGFAAGLGDRHRKSPRLWCVRELSMCW